MPLGAIGAIGWCLDWTVSLLIEGAEVAAMDRALIAMCSGLWVTAVAAAAATAITCHTD